MAQRSKNAEIWDHVAFHNYVSTFVLWELGQDAPRRIVDEFKGTVRESPETVKATRCFNAWFIFIELGSRQS